MEGCLCGKGTWAGNSGARCCSGRKDKYPSGRSENCLLRSSQAACISNHILLLVCYSPISLWTSECPWCIINLLCHPHPLCYTHVRGEGVNSGVVFMHHGWKLAGVLIEMAPFLLIVGIQGRVATSAGHMELCSQEILPLYYWKIIQIH